MKQALPQAAGSGVLLQSLDGHALVRLVLWDDPAAASNFRPPYFPSGQTYWRRDFTLASKVSKDGPGFYIDGDSAVQWSEFLMRDPADLPELSDLVSGMVYSMMLSGPESLLAVQELHA